MIYIKFILLIVGFLFLSSLSLSQSSNSKKEQYVLVSSGLIFSKSEIFNSHNFLKDKYSGGFSFNISLQRQCLKRLFFEANISVNNYWLGFRINDNNPFYLGSSNPAFVSLEGGTGIIYKVQTGKSKNILNLHLGLFIGYALTSKGHTGNIGYFNDLEGQDIINNLEGKVEQLSLLIFGNSIGISKDFRISKRMDIGLRLNYNIGYNTLMEIDINYSTTSSSTVHYAKSELSGTSWQTLAYLKYRVASKKGNNTAHNKK